MAQKPKRRSLSGTIGKVLIAAAVISTMVITVSAAEEISSWFGKYFSDQVQKPLTDSQLTYIEDNVQESIAVPVQETDPAQTGDGYKVEVKSAITDGMVAYVTVGVTAPEGKELPGVRFTNPLLIPDKTNGLRIAPDGSSPDALCDYNEIEDNDGLSNTRDVIFKIQPSLEDVGVHPFDGSIHWKMHLEGLENSYFTGEDFQNEKLSDAAWDFELTFQKLDVREVELIQEPISLMASKFLHEEYTIEAELTSFVISGLTHRITFTAKDPVYAEELLDIGDVQIVMKDGSAATLLRLSNWGSGSFGAPIILDEVDYILLTRDGTKIPMPQQ